MKNTFGRSFQKHVLACLCRVPEFAVAAYQVLQPYLFDKDRYQKAFTIAKEAWTKGNRSLVSKALFVESGGNPQLAEDIFSEDIRDWRATLEKVISFARIQATKRVIQTWATKIHDTPDDQLDEMIQDVRDAVTLGSEASESPGVYVMRDMHQHIRRYFLRKNLDHPIPTGMAHLDRAMEGGARRGHLNIFVGAPKIGKSTILMNVAYGAMCVSQWGPAHRVAFFTLENDCDMTLDRFYMRMARKGAEWFEENPKKTVNILKRHGHVVLGDTHIKWYPRNSMTPSMLRAYLDKLIAEDFHPDVVIVDYGNIMKPERWARERREREASCFAELSNIAKEYNVAVWSAAQANRESVKRLTVGMENVGESFEIVQIVDGLWTISQTPKEAEQNRCRIFGAALRHHRDRIIIECELVREQMLFRTLGFGKESETEEGEEGFDSIEKKISAKKKKRKKKK